MADEPVDVCDVAAYILSKQSDEMSTWKLEKLVYYCQAWHSVWEEAPLFTNEIQAWVNGPVVKDLFDRHKGLYGITASEFPYGDPTKLTKSQRESIDVVLKDYGEWDAQALSDKTHNEPPWKNARKGLGEFEYSDRVISLDSITSYFSAVYSKLYANA